MATSDIQVCNIALLRVGQRQAISSLNDTSDEAIACNALYSEARDRLLAEYGWKFAKSRAALAELATVTRAEWDYVYSLPADCLVPLYVTSEDGQRAPSPDVRIPFELEYESSLTSQVLMTDQVDAWLVYTAAIESVGLFPPHFVDALAWVLAADLALGLPVKPQFGLTLQGRAELAIRQAIAADLRQGQEDPLPEAEHVRAR